MEEKKYEGTVCITSQEYRELVTEAVQYETKYEDTLSQKWSLESKVKKLEAELAETRKALEETRARTSYFSQGLNERIVNPYGTQSTEVRNG